MENIKMILKIDLLQYDKVNFNLKKINNKYMECGNINTPNDWLFIISDDFSISKISKIITIPQTINDNNYVLSFFSYIEKFDFLKDLHLGLLHWTNHSFFKNKDSFSKKPRIEYNKNNWLIY